MQDFLKTEIPSGVKDILPAEATFKRRMEQVVSDVFQGWGYREVVTPVFEYFDVLKIGQQEGQIDRMYKFIDRQGRILALRPDMTTPIARLTASRMAEAPLPLRLFYIANVFSYEEPQAGRQREYYQAGIELIGSQSPEADAEVLAVTVEVLKSVGLKNFRISIGQIDVFNGLMEELAFNEEVRKEIKAVVSNKNFVGVEEILYEQGLSDEEVAKVMRIITLRGGRERIAEVMALVSNEKARKALENLEQVYCVLTDYELDQYVDLDLGLLRDFDYYTGMVFEGFSPGLGFPICGGGRYDRLLEQFGQPYSATGFALGMERLVMALEAEGKLLGDPGPDFVIAYTTAQRSKALKKARELRLQGKIVVAINIESETNLEEKDFKQDNILSFK